MGNVILKIIQTGTRNGQKILGGGGRRQQSEQIAKGALRAAQSPFAREPALKIQTGWAKTKQN